MKTLTLDDVVWDLQCEPEHIPIKGNCSAIDEETDRETEQWIMDQLDSGNQWAWCNVTLIGRYKGLTAGDSLGACSYRSEADFTAAGGYYDDMRANVLADLQRQLDEIVAEAAT